MKAELINLENQAVGEVDLDNSIFALDYIREDIIKLVIDWQLLKNMSGTHQTKTVSQVSGTTKKPFKQKGTGNARQGSLRSAQMRGGGISHGPVTRSHEVKLPKKVRKLGMKHALSGKFAAGKLLILDSLNLECAKTSYLRKLLENFRGKSYFIVSGEVINLNFALAVKNIPNVTVVPQIGANVYDVIRHEYILLSKEAVEALEKRLR